METLSLKKELLSCPGDTIQEHIDFIGMSQAELAGRMGRSVSKLNELIKGKAPITPETAQKLEYILGVDAGFWLNLEKEYQEELLEIKQLEFKEENKKWVTGFPLSALKKMGLLPNTRKKEELVEPLLKFFRVASPKEWSEIYEDASLAFKIELRHTTEPKAISSWLRIGELQTESIVLKEFDKTKLTYALSEIQILMYEKPENWLEKLQQICADFGVALVYTACISKAPIYGASRWIKNKTVPMIQLTDRQKDYNAFWFTFFHELGHIRYHNKTDFFINGVDDIQFDEMKEKQADEFAANMLLNSNERNEILNHLSFNRKNVLDLSHRLRKHPSIIVSQIQRENKHLYKSSELNQLKAKVEFPALAFNHY